MFSYSPFNPFARAEPAVRVEVSAELKATELLDHFCISCPKFGRKEGQEEKKVVFFSPEDESGKRKLELASFCEAVLAFTNDLRKTPRRKAHRFLTSGQLVAVIRPIDDFLVVSAAFNKEKCVKNNFHAHQTTIRKLLDRAIDTFELFNGSLTSYNHLDRPQLIVLLEQFFANYLPTLKFSTVPLIDSLDGISFIPLESRLFLETQCFVEQCVEQCPQVKQALFLYQTKLAQFSTPRHQLKTLFDFVTQHVVPLALKQELQPETVTSAQSGRFVRANFDFCPSADQFPVVYLKDDEKGEMHKYYMLCYRALNATQVMFMPYNCPGQEILLSKLHTFLQPRLPQISSEMAEAVVDVQQPTVSGLPFHFIYYNSESMSYKTSLRNLQPTQTTNINFNADTLSSIYDSYDKFVCDSSNSAEVVTKLDSDLWVAFKRSTGRILVVFIPNAPNPTLKELGSLVQTICEDYFQHVHFA